MKTKVVYGRHGKPNQYFIGDKEVTKEEYDAASTSRLADLFAGGEVMTQATTTWPMTSEALAVHPSQVDAANARNKAHGLAAHYDKTGMCHIPTREERKKLMRFELAHDNNGGYGD